MFKIDFSGIAPLVVVAFADRFSGQRTKISSNMETILLAGEFILEDNVATAPLNI